MKIRKPSAEALDKAARKLPKNRFGDAIANTVLAPIRRTHDQACTCGESDCPDANAS